MDRARSRKLFRSADRGIKDFELILGRSAQVVSTNPQTHTQSRVDHLVNVDPEDLYSSDLSDHSSAGSDTSLKSSSSSDQSDNEQSACDLRVWAVKHNITSSAHLLPLDNEGDLHKLEEFVAESENNKSSLVMK